MPTGNLEQEVTPATPPPQTKTFRWPADYYSSPPGDRAPLFPRWVPLGCGAAAAIFLLLLFAGGAFFSGPRLGEVVDLMLGSTLGELRTMFAPDVKPADKTAFESAVKTMREGIRARKVPVQDVQPFLKTMQTAVKDKRVTASELHELTRAANLAASAPSKSKPPKKQGK